VLKRKRKGRSHPAPGTDSLAGKFPDFWQFPRKPLGPVLPGFTTERSFWRGDRRV